MRYRITFKEVCRDLFHTFIIVSVIAVMLTVADSGRYFLSYFVMSQAFGLTICSITLFLFWFFKPRKWFGLFLVILTAAVSGVLIGMQTGLLILGHFLDVKHNWPMHEIIRTVVLALLFTIASFYFFITRSKLQSRREAIKQKNVVP